MIGVDLFRPISVSLRTLRVLRRNLVVWRSYLGASALGNFGEPLLYLAGIGFGLGALVPPEALGGLTYAEFLMPGLLVSTAMYTATFEGTFGSYTRMETQRTFESIVTTPISVEEVAFGDILFCALKATFGVAAVLVVSTAFGLVASPWALLALPLGFVVGMLFGALAVLVSAFARSYESFNYWFTIGIAPMFFFSGIFFPLDRFPAWAQGAAWILPPAHGAIVSRAVCRGALDPALLGHAAWLVVATALAVVPAVNAVRRRLVK